MGQIAHSLIGDQRGRNRKCVRECEVTATAPVDVTVGVSTNALSDGWYGLIDYVGGIPAAAYAIAPGKPRYPPLATI
jgi:hypothetical protein